MTMRTNRARKISEQAFNKLIEAVEAGKSDKLIEYLKVMGRFHRYSAMNSLLIGFQFPDATHVAGFHTWRKLGRYVKTGSKGIAIMAPIVWRKKIVNAQDDEPEEQVATFFKTVYIFDVSQTEGKPLPEFACVRGDPADYTHRLEEFISGQGIKLEYSDKTGSAEGVSCGGMIKVKKGLTAAETFSVLVHELSHEILHRDKDHTPKERKVRETEAEAVAFVVCQGIGLDVGSCGSDYIQLYDGDKKMLLESLERIQRTAAEILAVIIPDNNSRAKISMSESLASAAA